MAQATSPRCLVRAASLALASCWFGLPTAQAELMRYEYSGVITQVVPSANTIVQTAQGPSATFFTGPLVVGERFTGTFAYDPTESPDPALAPAGGGMSGHYGLSFVGGKPDADQLTVAVGGQTFLNQTSGLEITSTPGTGGSGAVTKVSISNRGVWDLFNTLVQLDFEGASPALYPPFGPPSMLKLSDFQRAEISAGVSLGGEMFHGTIDSLKLLTTTPEPSTCVLLGVGVALYWVRRRRVPE